MSSTTPPLPDSLRHLVPLVQRAVQAHRNGDRPTAERLCLDVLELVPVERDALRLLYEIRKAGGQRSAAEALIRRLVALDPNDFQATNELTLLLLDDGRLVEAELQARNAVRIAPENAQAHNLMGMVLTEAHKPQPGEHHYRRALALSGMRNPILLANLAWNLKNQGKMQAARQLYEESVASAPDVPQTLLGWARLEEADRQFDRASVILDRAERLFPDDPRLRLARAVLLGRMRRYEQALEVLNGIAGTSRTGELGPNELLEQGALLDQMGRYDEAFAAFEAGKRLARLQTGECYQAEQAGQLAERLRRFFTARRIGILPRAAGLDTLPQPIFILGFPRSGTTLVEQTLSAHPRISAGDELPFINEIAAIMPRIFDSPLGYPEALSELWMADHCRGLESFRDYYFDKVRQRDFVEPEAAWFTDKMPLNEMHLGLIALLFPAAPLIHVLRHPLDVVLSVFANRLTHGFFCASELETAARHYVLVMDLVDHYRHEMTLRYLPVRYEDIVDCQEASVRRMLGFIGEPFDDRCLRFHENRRYARTASYAQVAEKLYSRSRFRYRNYLAQLESVIPILQPVIHRLGYTV
ncbi:tetratricopeptide repeat-containing sulfotransferase family protein [Rhodopila globiformis]|uniref:tetratricopeptide repeat-containing sulfotransferase family protein n=1 Tax=Rhodopila globiformis TaxID=1071 RepID=UPI001EFD2DBB